MYKIKPNCICKKSYFSFKNFNVLVERFMPWHKCVNMYSMYHRFLINCKNTWTIHVLFLGSKKSIIKHHPFQRYQAWCCKVAFSQRDFEQCFIQRSSLERRYYVSAELTRLLYADTKDLIKIWTIWIRVATLYFASFC